MSDTHSNHRLPPATAALSRRTFLGRAASLSVAATAATGPLGAVFADARVEGGKLFLVALEEHFATRELQRLQAGKDEQLFSGGGRRPELLDLGAGRIADMDEAGIGIQVLSAVTPGAQNLPGAKGVAFPRKLNDWVANEVVAAHPNRFRAFATLALSEPLAAADELERAVREHGFVGCMGYGPIDGRFLDHADFAPVLARAEALGVPIYIHPNWSSREVMAAHFEGLGDPLASKILGGPGYGWHREVALQCLRLIVSGSFDRFPRLQIVVGHKGEGLSSGTGASGRTWTASRRTGCTIPCSGTSTTISGSRPAPSSATSCWRSRSRPSARTGSCYRSTIPWRAPGRAPTGSGRSICPG